jgi:cardiolipin synthase C
LGAAEGSPFVDLDVMAVDPVVREVSKDFDRYWANDSSYPLDRIVSSVSPANLANVEGLGRAPPEELFHLICETLSFASELTRQKGMPRMPLKELEKFVQRRFDEE